MSKQDIKVGDTIRITKAYDKDTIFYDDYKQFVDTEQVVTEVDGDGDPWFAADNTSPTAAFADKICAQLSHPAKRFRWECEVVHKDE